MLRSSYYHNQRHDYDEYPDPGDVIEIEEDIYDSLPSSPPRLGHVRFCDSPPMNRITVNELYSEREAILRFNRLWHHSKEVQLAVSPRYFDHNPELTPSMRCRLISWLLEVCLHFRLHRETWYLAVYFIDRYLSIRSGISKHSLQLLGISSLFIAAKLEEIYPPTLREFSDVCDGSCPTELIHETEVAVLMSLTWHLNVATPIYWVDLYMKLASHAFSPSTLEGMRDEALEFLDILIHTPVFIGVPYSLLAIAVLIDCCPHDSALFMELSGARTAELLPCVEFLSLVSPDRIDSLVYPPPGYRCGNEEFDQIVLHNSRCVQQILEMIKAGKFSAR